VSKTVITKKKKTMKSRSENEADILQRLSDGLSKEEIQRVLAGALNSLDQAGVDRLLRRLGSETETALRRILDADNSKQPAVPGRAKIKEAWEQAWEDWDCRIAEACASEGDYVIHEHHWEEPYFDPQSVTSDLEPIAVRVRKLLPRVFEENIDPDFSFAQAVQESVEEIESSLAEWMDPFAYEGFVLGPEATACLIDWEWRSARRRRIPLFQFFNQLCQLETSTKGLELDQKVLARFVHGLGADSKNDILKGIQAKRNQSPWKQVLGRAHSGWFGIYQELCRSLDHPAYLESCRARISQEWTLALPVMRSLERRKDHAETLSVCDAALRSFLHLGEGGNFNLGEQLLVVRAGYRLDGQPDARLLDLLEICGRSAHALQDEEAAVAARLQSDLLKHWRNWDKAIAAFRRVPQPRFTSLRERLFAQWRELVAERSVERGLEGPDRNPPPKAHWVHALADAAWEDKGKQNHFCAWLEQWLSATEQDDASLRRAQTALARLSLDLDRAAWLSSVSPTMTRLLAYNQSHDPALLASRKKWLERLGVSCLVPELLAFWRRNAQRLVPDPAVSGGSDYKSCADWARALWELNPALSQELLHQWSVAHRRRRNLWRALRAKGLSVSGDSGE
jgi:hypothetical protein